MASPRSQDLVFTLFGDYLLARDRPVWVGALIPLLGRLGMSAPATRTALSRMTARGWLVATRRGGRGFYGLSPRGRRLLEEGRQRIYHPPRHVTWDGAWYLVAYSIPETRRRLRDSLRSKLAWLGCGALTNGLWITPHDVRSEVADIARRLKVTRHVEIFRAEHTGFSSAAQLVAQCWDLAEVNASYCGQCRHAGMEAVRGRQALPCTSPEDCFERRFELVHAYRAFPASDPFLPAELLPEGWLGDRAAELFETYHAVLAEPAESYIQRVCATGDL